MKIALTHTGSSDKHSYYLDWLKGIEGVELVVISARLNNLHEMDSSDALVLSGGTDVHPNYYGSTKLDYPGYQKFDEKRDVFEIAAFNIAQQRQLPVLGICRGSQLINCILGGDLRQDLGTELNKIHEGTPDKQHPVQIEPGTLLHDITGSDTAEINSAHHQAIGRPGKGLKVNGHAKDGTIEGIEWADSTGKPFLLGVQWHPERMFKLKLQHTPASQKIRERFVEEIKKSKAGKQ
ncbi:MAG TPA: gamma-glutamyl-gamma-aminobutyrate hydrolase family protein [Chitinophagaceae bacterium]|jgi:putative glutamine amidotransferase